MRGALLPGTAACGARAGPHHWPVPLDAHEGIELRPEGVHDGQLLATVVARREG